MEPPTVHLGDLLAAHSLARWLFAGNPTAVTGLVSRDSDADEQHDEVTPTDQATAIIRSLQL
jgi:hypothetical protein